MSAESPDRIVWIVGDEPPLSRISRFTGPEVASPDEPTSHSVRRPSEPAPSMCTATDTVCVCADWRTWLLASYAPPTVRTYWGVLWRFFAHCPKPLGEITAEDVAAFLASYPYRSAARRTYYQALRSFFGYCEQRAIILVDPTAGLRVPAVIEKVPRALSTDEVWRVAVAAYARAPIRGFFVLTLYYTAARLTEAQNLRWTDIEGDELRIRVAKGGRERVVPIGPGLAAVLDALRVLQPGEYLFPRSTQTLWKWCRDAGRQAGIERVHPHLLRSTAATRMLVKGARPHAVREMLGHQSIRTTQRYWAVERGDVSRAAGML